MKTSLLSVAVTVLRAIARLFALGEVIAQLFALGEAIAQQTTIPPQR